MLKMIIKCLNINSLKLCFVFLYQGLLLFVCTFVENDICLMKLLFMSNNQYFLILISTSYYYIEI